MASATKQKMGALAAGVGASKLLLGLYGVMDPAALTIIVNTGDDIQLHGLKISPDLDIVTYTLAGIVDAAKGRGIRGDTFHALKRLAITADLTCSRSGRPSLILRRFIFLVLILLRMDATSCQARCKWHDLMSHAIPGHSLGKRV